MVLTDFHPFTDSAFYSVGQVTGSRLRSTDLLYRLSMDTINTNVPLDCKCPCLKSSKELPDCV